MPPAPAFGDIVVAAVPTALSVESAAGVYGGRAALSATLSSAAAGVAGKELAFFVGGRLVGKAQTDAGGKATLVGARAAGVTAGSHPSGVRVTYGGSAIVQPAAATGALRLEKATQTIAFNGLLRRRLGGHDVALTAQAPSGLPVRFAARDTVACAGAPCSS